MYKIGLAKIVIVVVVLKVNMLFEMNVVLWFRDTDNGAAVATRGSCKT